MSPLCYVPGFVHDVFVSYACVDDDRPKNADEPGWVSELVEQLTIRLGQLLGRRDIFSIWMDHQLAKNVEITPQIASTLERTALFMVVLSPGYLQSDWCRRERETFLKWTQAMAESGRVFLVERDRLEATSDGNFGKPVEFRDLLAHKFWEQPFGKNPRTLNRNIESDRKAYEDTLNELAHGISRELKALKKSGGEKIDPPNTRDLPRVFMAHVTDDLRGRRNKVKSHLEQFGLTCVLPDAGQLHDEDACEKHLASTMDGTTLFVQLLSDLPGSPAPNSKESLACYQHRLAIEAGMTVLQWRDPSLKEFNAEPTDDDVDVEAYRQVLFGATVRAINLEDFKQQIVELATKPKEVPPDPSNLMVYLNYNAVPAEDRALADEVLGYLDQKQIGVITPAFAEAEGADKPHEIRKEFEQNVRDSHGLIVLHSHPSTQLWARRQLSEIFRFTQEAAIPPKTVAMCIGPPPPKNATNPVGYKLPNMQVINLQAGFSVEEMQKFLRLLKPKKTSPTQSSGDDRAPVAGDAI